MVPDMAVREDQASAKNVRATRLPQRSASQPEGSCMRA